MAQSSKYVQQDGHISIFANDKEGKETRPDYTGTLTHEGVVYKVSLWKRVAKDSGQVYLSGEFEPRTKESMTSEQAKALQDFQI